MGEEGTRRDMLPRRQVSAGNIASRRAPLKPFLPKPFGWMRREKGGTQRRGNRLRDRRRLSRWRWGWRTGSSGSSGSLSVGVVGSVRVVLLPLPSAGPCTAASTSSATTASSGVAVKVIRVGSRSRRVSLPVDRSTHGRCAEGKATRLFDDGLVDGRVGGVHVDHALLKVNLGIRTSVTDKVDDPLFAVLLGQVEAGSKVSNVDLLVNAAVGLGDDESGCLDKLVLELGEEKVVLGNLLGKAELLLGGVKVKVDKELDEELDDGVRALDAVRLGVDDLDQVLERLLRGELVDVGTGRVGEKGRGRGLLDHVDTGGAAGHNKGSNKVSEKPPAGGLNGVEVDGGQEHFDQLLTAGRVVEEDKERPVEKP